MFIFIFLFIAHYNSDPESIDQDDLLDLTNCENDEIMLNHENCTSIINNGINSTM